MLSDDEIAGIATEILGKGASSQRVSVQAQSAIDFDGIDIVRVTARYSHRPEGTAYRGLDPMHDIRTALLQRGDDRFVYLRNIYDDVPDPEVDDAA